MAQLTELLARFEAATGPDRDLDARLHVALFPDERGMIFPGSTSGLTGSSHDRIAGMDWQAWADLAAHRGQPPMVADHHLWPTYTASLDAALAVVERALPNTSVAVKRWASGTGDAEIGGAGVADTARARAKTPAIALLAALLKARIATGEGKADG